MEEQAESTCILCSRDNLQVSLCVVNVSMYVESVGIAARHMERI